MVGMAAWRAVAQSPAPSLDPASTSVVKLVQAGQAAIAAGDWERARAVADNAIARDSGYADGWKLLGAVRLHAGETNAAVQAFRNAQLIAPRDPAANRELAWLLWSEDPARALEAIDVYLQSNPSDRDAVVRRVLALLAETGREGQALEWYHRWSPGFTLADLGVSLYDAGRHLAAYPFLRAAWEGNLARARVSPYLVVEENRRAHPDRALLCLKFALDQAPLVIPPDQAGIFWDAVMSMTHSGALSQLWAKIEARYPQDPEQWRALAARFESAAAQCRRKGDLATAYEFFRQATTLDPERASWADRIQLDEQLNGTQMAARHLADLLLHARTPGIRDGMRGREAHYAGHTAEAITLYHASLDAMASQLTLRLFLVRELLAAGQSEEARREARLAEALGAKSMTPAEIAELAGLWLEIGDVAHALALDPELLQGRTRALMASGDLESALRMAGLAISNQAAAVDSWLLLGMVQSRLQNPAAARVALERAVALQTNHVVALEELGWVLWASKEQEAAVATWERALSAGVKERGRFVCQILARMVEDNQTERAMLLHGRWLPDTSLRETGLELYRSGRMKAAQPFLARAWDAGAERAMTGLYLGRVRTINGVFAGTPELFLPFISSCMATADVQDVNAVLDSLKVCSGVAGVGQVLDAVAVAVSNRPDQVTAVTDLYYTFARENYDRRDFEGSMMCFEKVLARDPNRPVWSAALNLSRKLNELPRGVLLLSNILARSTSPAVKAGVQGKLSEMAGDAQAARSAYLRSLELDPEQPDTRTDLFSLLVASGQFDLARDQVAWMDERIKGGDVRLREVLAMMYSQLGEDVKARELWRFLHLSMPDDAPYYGTELAIAQFRTGQAREALENLKDLVIHTPIPLAFELMVQISAALGKPGEAVECSRAGLAQFSTPNLRRGLAENLETIQSAASATATLQAAQAALTDDVSSVSASLLLARSLEFCGRRDEAADVHRRYLARNPDFSPSLIYLRDHEVVEGRPRQALPYASRLAQDRVTDDQALRRYAMTLAEADGFSRAIRILEPMARRDEKATTAVLVYDNTTPFDYPGMNSVSQMVAHVGALRRGGYYFVTQAVATEDPVRRVVMILMDPDLAVVEAMDQALASNRACAVLMVSPAALDHQVPRKPSPERLRALQSSGRWCLGVLSPDLGAVTVGANGLQGNPLTHRLWSDGVRETDQAMSNRLATALAPVAALLPAAGPRLFYYPAGDYGQLSLDTDAAAIATLSNVTARLFTGAFSRDDEGFVAGAVIPNRMPSKAVPAEWSADQLTRYLQEANPVVRSRLELAKLLYWHGQVEVAEYWFRRARAGGGNPFEVTFNRAANAALEGDLPQALRLSSEAMVLEPPDEHRPEALHQKALDMRRPTLSLTGSYWWDNEDYSGRALVGEVEGPLRDALRGSALAGREIWQKKGLGHESGTEGGLGFLAYVAPEVWIQGGLQEWFMDDLPDLTGWNATLHLPDPYLKGHMELSSQREMMETVEALRKGITAHREELDTYTRVYDFWDCFLDGALTERSDANDTWVVNARIVRRLKETPYYGVGYMGRYADSTTRVQEYWSPLQLQQHQAYAAWQGTGDRWNLELSGQTGVARERNTGWRGIWGGRAVARYQVTPRLSAGGDGTYQSGPVYSRTSLNAFLALRW